MQVFLFYPLVIAAHGFYVPPPQCECWQCNMLCFSKRVISTDKLSHSYIVVLCAFHWANISICISVVINEERCLVAMIILCEVLEAEMG